MDQHVQSINFNGSPLGSPCSWALRTLRSNFPHRVLGSLIAVTLSSVEMTQVVCFCIFRFVTQFSASQMRLTRSSLHFAKKSDNLSPFISNHNLSIGLRSGEYGGRKMGSKLPQFRDLLRGQDALSTINILMAHILPNMRPYGNRGSICYL